MERLFVDTSAWYAYVNRKDPDHGAVAELFRGFRGRLLTSNFVFDETVTLCRHRLGWEAARKVGTTLLDADSVDLIRLSAEDERHAWALFLNRPEKSYSYTDCTSFVLLDRLGCRRVAALDSGFRREGFETEPG